MNKIIKLDGPGSWRETRNNPHERVVHCHGVFDVLHIGHINYFREAKELGDILIVTITSDRYVNKGPGRPYFSETIRANMLANLEVIDYVAISDFPTAKEAIEKIEPDFYVKGPDYRDHTKDVTGEIKNELAAVEKHGGQIAYTSGEMFSSSNLINRFMNVWTDEQQIMITKAKMHGIDKIRDIIQGLAKMNITVTGEPIKDVYRFVEPQNISSKSPSISARYLYEETYAGGSLAIANHLADFVNKLTLVTTTDGSFGGWIQSGRLDRRVIVEGTHVPHRTPEKIRYIAIDKSQRIFEVTECPDNQWDNRDPGDFIYSLKKSAEQSDLLIVADFGHGLFEGKALWSLNYIDTQIALNVQTNSSNYGFNVFTKHKSYDYLSIDLREARLAWNNRSMTPDELIKALPDKNKGFCHSLTLGKNGSYFNTEFSPAFADQVIDATGAGDAYFAITALLVKAQCPTELIPFIGNVYAGLKTKVVGNKSAITKAALLKALEGILK